MDELRESRIRALEQTVVGLRRELRMLHCVAMGLVVMVAGVLLVSAARESGAQDLVEAREFRVIGAGDKVAAILKSGEQGGEIRVFGLEREALRLEAAPGGGAVSIFAPTGAKAAQVLSEDGRGACRLFDEVEKPRIVHRVTGERAEFLLFDHQDRCQLSLSATETTGRIEVFGGAMPTPQIVVDTSSAGPRVVALGGSISVVGSKDGRVLSALGRDAQGGEITVRSALGQDQARLASDPRGGLLMLRNRAGKRSRVLRVN